ncbi:serine/threonine-protein phosphatase 4 regulatory subunit 4-like [Dermacentor andersoni]|uniref:serine/threonine-protein phosphatase 4 regulatory subunit 4-like n=1 Tax=Dermacentor andersoni TaxID=34620 RepID=UPI002155E91D|nr:serine/threonine-protein phosphatase 4 regulatory subunit 4-like [Dermacentor andersoni]
MVPANVSEPREMSCSSPPLMPAEDGCRSPDEHGAQPTLQPAQQDGKSLVHLFDGGTLVSQSFAQSLLQSILSSVESRDPVVATAWADTLLDVLELLPRATISQQVLPVAVQKGQVSQSPLSRLVSCRLLGAVAALLETVVVQKELLPLAESLCRDPDPDVRASMCCQLGTLTRSIGLGMTKQYLLPCLVELSSDADSAVRRAALEATVTMLGLLDDVPCRDNLVSLVLRWRQRSAGELAFLATQFGPLCRLPTGIVEKDGWLVELYQQLSTAGLCVSKNSPDRMPTSQAAGSRCRRTCAHFFPDLVQFVTAESFEAKLLPVWKRLCADPDPSVRSVIAGAVIQVVNAIRGHGIVGWPHLLLPETCKLLTEGLLAESLSGLVQALLESRDHCCPGCRGCDRCCTEEQLVELVSAAEACIARVGLKWRREVAIWSALGCFTGSLLQTSLEERITQRLLRRTQASGPLPCRLAAVQSLVAFLRRGTSGQEQLLADITRDLAEGRSCRSRLMFVHLCAHVQDSRLLTQWQLLQHLHRLAAEDSVESIRRQAGRCLEQLEPQSKAEQQSTTSRTRPATTRRLKAMALCVLKGSSLEHHSSSKVPVSARHWPMGLTGKQENHSSSHVHKASAMQSQGRLAERSPTPSRIPVLESAYRCRRQPTETVGKQLPD